MRILVDASPLLLRSAGVKTYTYHWIEHLRRQAGEDSILTFPHLGTLPPLDHERSLLNPFRTYSHLALLALAPGLLRVPDADVFHVSSLIHNPPRKIPLTATIHDMTCRLMPELHTPANRKADEIFTANVLRRAARLIAVSQNTKTDAVRLAGLDPERIEVIYSGVPEAYFGAQPAPAARPYVLFVGTIEPRKNIGALLDAWEGFSGRNDFDLVIAGAGGWSSETILARLAAKPAGIRYLGYVVEEKLPGLTAGATAFIYPSLYEGFGFPVAQAMAAGVPVITSNVSCLPEIAGEAALLVDPRSATEIRAALDRLLGSRDLRQQLRAAGNARAQRYRWELCARKSLEFFHRAV